MAGAFFAAFLGAAFFAAAFLAGAFFAAFLGAAFFAAAFLAGAFFAAFLGAAFFAAAFLAGAFFAAFLGAAFFAAAFLAGAFFAAFLGAAFFAAAFLAGAFFCLPSSQQPSSRSFFLAAFLQQPSSQAAFLGAAFFAAIVTQLSQLRVDFNVEEALNFMAFDALICTGSPVRGLRPVRAGRLVTLNAPNPGQATLSPCFAPATTVSKNAPIVRSASAFDTLAALATASMSSDLVINRPFILYAGERDCSPGPTLVMTPESGWTPSTKERHHRNEPNNNGATNHVIAFANDYCSETLHNNDEMRVTDLTTRLSTSGVTRNPPPPLQSAVQLETLLSTTARSHLRSLNRGDL